MFRVALSYLNVSCRVWRSRASFLRVAKTHMCTRICARVRTCARISKDKTNITWRGQQRPSPSENAVSCRRERCKARVAARRGSTTTPFNDCDVQLARIELASWSSSIAALSQLLLTSWDLESAVGDLLEIVWKIAIHVCLCMARQLTGWLGLNIWASVNWCASTQVAWPHFKLWHDFCCSLRNLKSAPSLVSNVLQTGEWEERDLGPCILNSEIYVCSHTSLKCSKNCVPWEEGNRTFSDTLHPLS